MVPNKGKCRDPVLLLAQERAARQEFLRGFGSSRHAKRAAKGELGSEVQPASSRIGGDAQSCQISLAAGHNSQDGDCEAATKGKRGRLGGTISRRIICSDSNVDVAKMSKHRMLHVAQELSGNRDVLPKTEEPILQSQRNFTSDPDVVAKEERPTSLQDLKDSEASNAARTIERSEESPQGTSSHDVSTPAPFDGKSSNCDKEAELNTEVSLKGRGYRDTYIELRTDLQQLAADSLGKGLEELRELGINAVPLFLSKLQPTSLADGKTSPQERRKVNKVAKSTATLEPSRTSIVKPHTRSDNVTTPSFMVRSGSEGAAADKREPQLAGLVSALDLPMLSRPSQGITVAFCESGGDDTPGLKDYQRVGVDYRAVSPVSSNFGAVGQLSYDTLLSDQSLSGDEQPTAVLPRPELGFSCSAEQKNLLWDLNLPAKARDCLPLGVASNVFLSPVRRLSYEGPEPILPFDLISFGREIVPYGCERQNRLEVEDNPADLPRSLSLQQLENGLVHAAAWGEVLSPAVDSLRGGDIKPDQFRWQPTSVVSPPEERRIYGTQFLPLEGKRSTRDLFGRYDEFM